MFYIGEFSKMSRVTIKTLHYYDRIGLLCPENVDKVTGYRIYSTRQLVKLHRIQSLKQAGLSIDEILAITNDIDIRPILEQRKIALEQELRAQQKQLAHITYLKDRFDKEYHMDYQATIKDIPSYTIYTKRLTVPNHAAYHQVIPAIGQAVKKANPDIECSKPEYCYICYLDGEYKECDINIEFNEAVNKIGIETDGIFFRESNPVTVASVLHKGSYADLPKAYAFIMDWVEKNGYKIDEMPRESYIDGCWNKESESEWLTEIQIPIRR